MAANRNYLTQSLNVVGAGPDILELRGIKAGSEVYIDVQVEGAFTGSVRVEEARPGSSTFVPVSNTTMTAPGSTIILASAPKDYRFYAVTLSTGPVNCYLHVL